MYKFSGDVPYQFAFHRQGRGCRGWNQAYPVAHAEYVRIYGKVGLVVDHGGNHIRRLSTYARQFHQFLHRQGHLTVKFLHQHLRHADEVFRLIPGVTDTLYQFEEFIVPGLAQGRRVGIPGEEGRRGHVHALIGALGRKDNGNKQLVRTIVNEFRFGIGTMFLEIIDDESEPFLSRHDAINMGEIKRLLGQIKKASSEWMPDKLNVKRSMIKPVLLIPPLPCSAIRAQLLCGGPERFCPIVASRS